MYLFLKTLFSTYAAVAPFLDAIPVGALVTRHDRVFRALRDRPLTATSIHVITNSEDSV